MTKQNADHSQTAAPLLDGTSDSVHDAENSVVHMAVTMETIQDASAQTAKITRPIDEIAFQANLRAL